MGSNYRVGIRVSVTGQRVSSICLVCQGRHCKTRSSRYLSLHRCLPMVRHDAVALLLKYAPPPPPPPPTHTHTHTSVPSPVGYSPSSPQRWRKKQSVGGGYANSNIKVFANYPDQQHSGCSFTGAKLVWN